MSFRQCDTNFNYDSISNFTDNHSIEDVGKRERVRERERERETETERENV